MNKDKNNRSHWNIRIYLKYKNRFLIQYLLSEWNVEESVGELVEE